MTNNPLIPSISDTAVAKQKRRPSNPLIDVAHNKAQKPELNPMIARATKSSNPLIPNPELPREPSTLEAVANVLELPKSSVLDTLAGENPLDQWATPTRSINRTTGKQFLQEKKLIDDSDSWKNAIAGFGVDVIFDPLTYFGGVGALTKSGKAASKAGLLKGTSAASSLQEATTKTARQLLDEAEDGVKAHEAFKLAGGTDNLLDQPLKRTIDFMGHDIGGKGLAGALDKAKDLAIEVPGMRHLRAAFSPAVLNTVTKAGQDIAEVRKTTMDETLVDLGYRFAEPIRNSDAATSKALLQDVARQAEQSGLEMNRFADYIDASDVNKAYENSQHLSKASAMAHASQELLGTAAKTDGSGVPMLDALKRLGLDTEASRKAVSDWSGGRAIESLSIDKALLDDAGRFIKPYTDPEIVGGVRKAIEGFNRVLKSNLTLPFPQWHFRNALGAMVQNVSMGASDLKHLPKDLMSVLRMKQGKSIRGLSKDIPEYKAMGVSDAEATKMLKDEMFAHGVTTTQSAADVAKNANRMLGSDLLLKTASRDANTKNRLASLNPLDVDNFIPTKIGGKVANQIEDFNRATPYINLRRQGYTPEMAAARVGQLQIRYDSLTQFEKKYARNLIPFWSFSSRMLPLIAKELIKHPGGPTAQLVRAGAKSDRSSDKPNWMKGETSIPIDGKHFSGLGLMHEDATKLLGPLLKGDLPELAKQVGSRVNPLIRFPVEQATQRDIHSGRSLNAFDDASKLLGQELGPTAEHAIRSSPLVRYAAEARELQKKREKALLKFTTGLNSNE